MIIYQKETLSKYSTLGFRVYASLDADGIKNLNLRDQAK